MEFIAIALPWFIITALLYFLGHTIYNAVQADYGKTVSDWWRY